LSGVFELFFVTLSFCENFIDKKKASSESLPGRPNEKKNISSNRVENELLQKEKE